MSFIQLLPGTLNVDIFVIVQDQGYFYMTIVCDLLIMSYCCDLMFMKCFEMVLAF